MPAVLAHKLPLFMWPYQELATGEQTKKRPLVKAINLFCPYGKIGKKSEGNVEVAVEN